MIYKYDMLDAVAKFILEFAPGQTEEHLYRGYQNRMALPDEQDYTIFAIEGTERVGTDISSYGQAADDKIDMLELRGYTVSVDFCSSDDKTAAMRATTLENIGRSYIAVDYLKQYGVNINYCNDVEYLPFTDNTDQYIYRYRVTLNLTKWERVTLPQQYAEQVKLQRIENIDTHHIPK